MQLLPVSLIDEEVRKSLKRVKEKTGEPWSPEFVMKSIEAGHSGLFHFWDDGHLAFMVVEKMWQGEKAWMNVWIVEGEGLEKAEEALPLIDDLAKWLGCDSWRCTGRKGWERIGLKPVATVYERTLT